MDIVFKPVEVTEIIKPAYDLPTIGEPISKGGASANDSNAYGVVVGIIGDGNTRRVRVMTKGYIDYDKVKENYMEYSPECISALSGITLCSGGKYPAGSAPSEDAMAKVNPTGSGSLSINRKAGTTIGLNSVAVGHDCEASGEDSFAEGWRTQATGQASHAEGTAGRATGQFSHAEGSSTIASGSDSHAEGWGCRATGATSHAEGDHTRASSSCQHVQGKFNVEDSENKYASIIGNGTAINDRHNCFMVGWDGAIYVQASDDATKMMKITVASDGTITATEA